MNNLQHQMPISNPASLAFRSHNFRNPMLLQSKQKQKQWMKYHNSS
jgi:hypothetical protein